MTRPVVDNACAASETPRPQPADGGGRGGTVHFRRGATPKGSRCQKFAPPLLVGVVLVALGALGLTVAPSVGAIPIPPLPPQAGSVVVVSNINGPAGFAGDGGPATSAL